jgi:hypothetical protein
MIKYALLLMTIAVTLVAVTYCAELPQEQPVTQTDKYKRPVREGNCWRQFTATDSILVCH